MIKHQWRHKTPRYKGGTNDINNLVLLSKENHYKLHLIRYYMFKDHRELSGAQLLYGQYRWRTENPELYSKLQSDLAKRQRGKKHPNKGLAMKKRWESEKESLSKAMRGKRKIVECPHCGLKGGGGNMHRYHFDKCKENK